MKTTVFAALFPAVFQAVTSVYLGRDDFSVPVSEKRDATFALERKEMSSADSAGIDVGPNRGGGFTAMFWNLENFFDYKDGGGGDSDREFSSEGLRRWTKSRFYAKCNAVAKTIFWIKDRTGRLPDVIGFAEVENRFVLNSVLRATSLKKTDYGIVHFDSPDPRGIDVALLYRKEIFRKVSAKPCRIYDGAGNMIRTRDILCVELCGINDGETVYFLVNHHPSKFGGASASKVRRELAMRRLKEICDSLVSSCVLKGKMSSDVMPETEMSVVASPVAPAGMPDILPDGYKDAAIVAMGDFNDTPDNGLFSVFDGKMCTLADKPFRRGEGTIRYAGRWDLIDMFLVSAGIAENYVQEILYPPFLMVEDKSHGGLKPLRTYVGPRYQGGISDHCPIVLMGVR